MPNFAAAFTVLNTSTNLGGHTSGAAVFHMPHGFHHVEALWILATRATACLIQTSSDRDEVFARPAEAEAGEALPLGIIKGPNALLALPQFTSFAEEIVLNTLTSLLTKFLHAQVFASFYAGNLLMHLKISRIVICGASTTTNPIEGTSKLLPLTNLTSWMQDTLPTLQTFQMVSRMQDIW